MVRNQKRQCVRKRRTDTDVSDLAEPQANAMQTRRLSKQNVRAEECTGIITGRYRIVRVLYYLFVPEFVIAKHTHRLLIVPYVLLGKTTCS